MTTPAEWFDSPNKPPANVTPETIAAASAPLASSAQSAWFQLARKIDESEATYRHLSERCLKSWDYPSALRWRAIADGLNLARSHMEEIAAATRQLIAAAQQAEKTLASRPHRNCQCPEFGEGGAIQTRSDPTDPKSWHMCSNCGDCCLKCVLPQHGEHPHNESVGSATEAPPAGTIPVP